MAEGNRDEAKSAVCIKFSTFGIKPHFFCAFGDIKVI